MKNSTKHFQRLSLERLENRIALSVSISEISAAGTVGFLDEDNDAADWIELINSSNSPMDLNGWHLTDDPNELTKWRLPAIPIEAHGYLVVFASGKNRRIPDSNLHTNFRLNSAGEYLALINAEGSVVSAFSPSFPQQFANRSYAVPAGNQQQDILIQNARYFAEPTPGASNTGEHFKGVVDPVQFSVARGFFERQQDVVLVSPTLGSTIAYTTDGSEPSFTNGQLVAAKNANTVPRVELTIGSTTTLRAATLKTDYLPNTVETHTYVFVDDVIQQSPNGEAPEGWPSRPINRQQFDYGIDPEIANHQEYGPQLRDALLDLPSFSIVMDLDDLFDPEIGFFVNGEEARANARPWERPTSVELIYPDGTDGFQIDAGIRMRGGFSRRPDNPKHAFRFFFREEYGDSKLSYPLFGESGAAEFDNFDLRTAQVPSWSLCWPNAPATGGGCRFNTMVRDVFSRDLQGDMGQPFTRSEFYHLYLNGHYWGLFQSQERPEASFAATYFGGAKSDYDVLKVEAFPHRVVATDGNMDAWRTLWEIASEGFESDEPYQRIQGLDSNGVRDESLPVLLDVDNLINYTISILYTGNLDAPISNFLDNRSTNNWFGIRNRNTHDGFRFFVHDAEWTLIRDDTNRVGPWPAGNSYTQSNPQWLHQQLMQNAEYRLRFADHVQKHFFDDGALTPAASLARLQDRADEIDLAIIAESARWGDTHRSRPLTKTDWQKEIDRIVEDIIPVRTDIVLQQLRDATLADGTPAELYTKVNAPTLSQTGGRVQKGFELSISSDPDADVFFTTDGSDPRAQPAIVDSSKLIHSLSPSKIMVPKDDAIHNQWYSSNFDDTEWTDAHAAIGFQRSGNDYADLIQSNIEEAMLGKNGSVYIRIPFELEKSVEEIDLLQLRLNADDGYVVYLNGNEIARRFAPEQIQWNSTATRSLRNAEVVIPEEIDLAMFANLFVSGKNVLAIQGLNRRIDNSDFLMVPDLEIANVLDPGNSESSQRYESPVPITENTTVTARAFSDGTWSAIVKANFQTDSIPLRITEIMYHPKEPSVAEREAGFLDDDDFEFVELFNHSDKAFNLAGVSIQGAIEFEFSDHIMLPRERLTLVKNKSAFQLRHGDQIAVAGEYRSQLSNATDKIEIFDVHDHLLQSVTYLDDWYSLTDGNGHSLEFVGTSFDDPALWSSREAWSPSLQVHGTPSQDRFPLGDSNRDGVFNSRDLVHVFQAGEYEDGIPQNSRWEDGDWNEDGEFDSADLVLVFQFGNYRFE